MASVTCLRGLGSTVLLAAGYYHNCAVSTEGLLTCWGLNMDGQCNVPSSLGPVIAVAAGMAHSCVVGASGKLVCFGANVNGQCDVPPGLGPVVAVAAGWCHTSAVTAAGELVCFGKNDGGQCNISRDFRVQLLTPAAHPNTPVRQVPQTEPAASVLQLVDHAEPAADITEEEGAAIVAQQETSWIEHNIGYGYGSYGDTMEYRTNSTGLGAFARVLLLQFSRAHPRLKEVLEQSEALQPMRDALEEAGEDWRLQPSGAKVFMEPRYLRAIRGHLSTLTLRACHVLVTQDVEELVMHEVLWFLFGTSYLYVGFIL